MYVCMEIAFFKNVPKRPSMNPLLEKNIFVGNWEWFGVLSMEPAIVIG